MCNNCGQTFKGNNDPTKTITLRNLYASDFEKRYRTVKGLIRQSIDKNDCFGLRKSSISQFLTLQSSPVDKKAYEFKTTPDKIDSFMDWLKSVQETELFEVIDTDRLLVGAVGTKYGIWQNKYLYASYKKGTKWGRQQIKKDKDAISFVIERGMDIATDDITISSNITGPVALEEVRTIYLRAYNDLRGITGAMDAQISRVLAEGLSLGWNPTRIANAINKTVDGIGKYRSLLLARTEVVRAHHLASIRQYELYEMAGVKVVAEWRTARDVRVCPLCAPLDYNQTGKLWTLSEIRGKIPVHPLCRCAALPMVKL